jgi:hypothetical protein
MQIHNLFTKFVKNLHFYDLFSFIFKKKSESQVFPQEVEAECLLLKNWKVRGFVLALVVNFSPQWVILPTQFGAKFNDSH